MRQVSHWLSVRGVCRAKSSGTVLLSTCLAGWLLILDLYRQQLVLAPITN